MWCEIGEKRDYPYVPQPFETMGGVEDGIYCFLVYGEVPVTIVLSDQLGRPYARYSLLLWGDLRLRYFREKGL